MKWYKQQMDKLKIAKSESSEPGKMTEMKKLPRRSFDSAKIRLKKIAKPGERRSRAKTDSF